MKDNNSAKTETAQNPHGVTRGLKTQLLNLGLDSLYLILEYSSDDQYRHWSYLLNSKQITLDELKEGVLYDGMLLRPGGLGYKISVWDGDARLFLTDRVNDNLIDTPQEGQGMGIMLQLGPKWLQTYGDVHDAEEFIELVHTQFCVFGIFSPENYHIRINRIDIALDVLNMPIAEFSINDWREQWVGRASQRIFHDSAQNGELETISIGTSKGAVRFKTYNKLVEATKSGSLSFWLSVWGIHNIGIDVTRFEWTTKPYQAKIENMQYLEEFTFEGFLGLLNYVTLEWGRLCIPEETETNKNRWELAPLWKQIRGFIDDWSINYDGSAKRRYDYSADINDAYLRNIAGWLSGLMAKLGHHREGPVSLDAALQYLHEQGHTREKIKDKAQKKWLVLSRTTGRYEE